MTLLRIESIIVKYLTKSATLPELNLLTEWIEAPENKEIFKTFVQTHYEINYSVHNPDSEKLIEELLLEIMKNKSFFHKRRYKSVLKYAAIFLGIIGITYFVDANFRNKNENDFVISKEDIILKLENGNVKIITNNGCEKVVNTKGEVIGLQNGNQLNYNNNRNNSEKIAYNELTVPYGKIFDLVLSDGTKVKLNAGTSLKYPVKFIKSENRKVFLKGEAYFDVIKDDAHPFIVNANEINVRVLGTKFNISSYAEDNQINTVLVEGSVSVYKKEDVYNNNTASLLKPGYKAAWNKKDENIAINKADISLYTAWIDGKLIFKDSPFKIIRKKLERKYNVSITNKNVLLEDNTFNAIFDIETIEEVLEILDKNFGIKYEINENQIIIN